MKRMEKTPFLLEIKDERKFLSISGKDGRGAVANLRRGKKRGKMLAENKAKLGGFGKRGNENRE
jgi:hypothetical protein